MSVVTMDGQEVQDTREPNKYAIEVVEDIFERVKSGEVVGVAVVFEYADETVGDMRGGRYSKYRMMGGLMSTANAIDNE